MASYSGKVVRWDDAIDSTLELVPKDLSWNADPQVHADSDGLYPCAMPGVSKAGQASLTQTVCAAQSSDVLFGNPAPRPEVLDKTSERRVE